MKQLRTQLSLPMGIKGIVCALALFFGLALSAAGLAPRAYAVDVVPICSGSASNTDVCKEVKNNSTNNPIVNILRDVLDILSFIVGLAAVIMGIIAGIKFITSGGDPAGIRSARDTILYALIGVAVVLTAQAIVTFVLNKLQ